LFCHQLSASAPPRQPETGQIGRQAVRLYAEMMQTTPDTARLNALFQEGVAGLRAGNGAAARAPLQAIAASGQANAQVWLMLAQACDLQDDRAAARAALQQVLAADGRNPYALAMMGDVLARDGDDRAAVGWLTQALAVTEGAQGLPADLVARLERAAATRNAITARFADAMHAALARAGVDAAAAGDRFAESIAIVSGQAQPMLQQPTSFYYPGLPQRAFYDRAEFAWVPALEAATDAIRAEAAAVLADPTGVAPYVAAEADRPAKAHSLLNDARWSAFHLFEGGQPVPARAARCPATMAALADLPLPRVAGRAPMVLFSILAGGTHIQPHTGMLNTRLICHLPLIVPAGCRLRVGNHTRAVEPGKMLIFDDSIEHEAWNDSGDVRVILLFEIWRPELSAAERAGLTALYESVAGYGADQA
jgi:aspartyl/asparaginyl beta-hydroxylase (cupin superfamily)